MVSCHYYYYFSGSWPKAAGRYFWHFFSVLFHIICMQFGIWRNLVWNGHSRSISWCFSFIFLCFFCVCSRKLTQFDFDWLALWVMRNEMEFSAVFVSSSVFLSFHFYIIFGARCRNGKYFPCFFFCGLWRCWGCKKVSWVAKEEWLGDFPLF